MSTHPASVQYCPFNLQTAPDLARNLATLRERADELSACAKAPNTVKAYVASWKIFAEWCREWRHCDALPAAPEIVREFVAWGSEMRTPPYKGASIQLILSAVNRVHRDASLPVPGDAGVRAILAGMKRKAARQGARPELAGKKHLTLEQLRKICASLGTEMIDLRDRALILVGFASALRRSDIARLETRHVHLEAERVRLWVPISKTDQEGSGRDVFMDASQDPALCPLRALDAWKKSRLEYFGNARGALFLGFSHLLKPSQIGLSGQGVCRVLKRHLERVGVDSRDYGAHSMRSGMITAADAGGASLRTIMDHTGHRKVETVMRYIKSTRGSNPLAGVL